MSENADQVPF